MTFEQTKRVSTANGFLGYKNKEWTCVKAVLVKSKTVITIKKL